VIAVPPGEPIGWFDPGRPSVYGALGAIFHLEVLDASDEERLDRVSDLLWDWFGAELRWSTLSCAETSEPARRSHLEYIGSFAANLDAAPAPAPEQQRFHNLLTRYGRTDYFVICAGADKPTVASPFSIRFWAEIGEPPEHELALPACSVLHFTVPEAWPVDDFYTRVCAIAAELRLRWGAAGLTYSPLDLDPGRDAERAQYAHARRYVGYDLPAYVQLVEPFYRRLRSINWLTFVGPALAAELSAQGRRLASTPNVEVLDLGGTWMLRAGPRPERGDVNRLWIPPAYREADALLRPIRSTGEGLDFLQPWDEESTARWLRRFEYQSS
jgi:Protein of unknown function (DUF3396)